VITLTDVESCIEIGASASRVWSVLTDLEHYPEWNPWIREARGRLIVGAELDLTVAPPDLDVALVRVVVEKVVPVGSAVLRFDWPDQPGRVTCHEYRLEPVRGGTKLHQVHRVVAPGSGPPEPVGDRTALAMEMMSAALKARAER
jgi:uncharacterized protein YndB with AHSA1/START domain